MSRHTTAVSLDTSFQLSSNCNAEISKTRIGFRVQFTQPLAPVYAISECDEIFAARRSLYNFGERKNISGRRMLSVCISLRVQTQSMYDYTMPTSSNTDVAVQVRCCFTSFGQGGVNPLSRYPLHGITRLPNKRKAKRAFASSSASVMSKVLPVCAAALLFSLLRHLRRVNTRYGQGRPTYRTYIQGFLNACG